MFEQYIHNNYLRAGVILIALFIVLKILIFVIEKIILKFTLKTKTNLDDQIISKSSKPITLAILLIGIKIALKELVLIDNLYQIFNTAVDSLLIIVISYLAYVIIILLIFQGWKKISTKAKSEINKSLTNLVKGFLKTIWIIFTLIYVLNLWGIEVGPFLAGLGIGGIAVAFALQSSLANIFAGISIILDKTVKIGDLIFLDDGTQGKVESIGLRSTKVKTFDNELIILPNSKLADGKIQNVAMPEPKSRVVIPFGVAYGVDVDKVKKIVLTEIKKIKHFVNDPEPVVRFLEMADSSLNFKAYFYVDSFEYRANAIDEANTKIYNALRKNNIEIPFPQLDVHVKK